MAWPKGRKHTPEMIAKVAASRAELGQIIDWMPLDPVLRDMARKGDKIMTIGKRLGVHPVQVKARIIKLGLAAEHIEAWRKNPRGPSPRYPSL